MTKRLYGPRWAVLLARLIGHRQPLIDRLLDQSREQDQIEREFHAAVYAGKFKWPKGNAASVDSRREKLRRAAVFLRLHVGQQMLRPDALEETAKECRCSERWVEKSLKFAEDLGGGEWWRAASRLARKRKFEALARTY
jgi:hypothetical protein